MTDSRRRNFLKLGALGCAALAAWGPISGCNLARAQIAPGQYTEDDKALKAKRWAMVIDTRRFSSNDEYLPLIEACRLTHNIPTLSGPQGIKWIWTDSYIHVFQDELNRHQDAHTSARFYPLLCNHCAQAPCVRVCPAGATYCMPNGIVAIDYHRCIGCRFCMAACPYGARSFNFVDPRRYLPEPAPNPAYPTRMIGVVEKCNFCVERLALGRLPACVEASAGKVLFGDLEDPHSNVRQALAENFSLLRKAPLGTEPAVYYLV